MVNQMIRIPKGCVLWLDLTEDTGDIVYDRSGHGNNGKVYGPVLEKRLPFIGRRFDGEDDYVEIPYSEVLAPSTLTVVVWYYRKSYPSATGYDLGCVVDNKANYQLKVKRNGLIYWQYHNGGTWQIVKVSSTVNEWHFVVAMFIPENGNTRAKVYVDSQLKTDTLLSGSRSSTTEPLRIGAYSSSVEQFNGLIAHVSIYNRALSGKEIKRLYEEFQKRIFRRIDPLNIRMR